MTLRSIWRVITAWKWIAIIGTVLALAGGTATFLVTPPTQTVTSSYLFLSPVKDTKGVAGNPFLQLGNGVPQIVDVLAISLSDGDTVRKYTDDDPDLTYTASRNLGVSAPLLVISVESTNLAQSDSTLDALGEDLAKRLSELQTEADARASQWITMTRLTRDPEPEIGYADPLRNGVLVLFGVGSLTAAIIVICERRRLKSIE